MCVDPAEYLKPKRSCVRAYIRQFNTQQMSYEKQYVRKREPPPTVLCDECNMELGKSSNCKKCWESTNGGSKAKSARTQGPKCAKTQRPREECDEDDVFETKELTSKRSLATVASDAKCGQDAFRVMVQAHVAPAAVTNRVMQRYANLYKERSQLMVAYRRFGTLYDAAHDGHCLFHALAIILFLNEGPHMSAGLLRSELAQQLLDCNGNISTYNDLGDLVVIDKCQPHTISMMRDSAEFEFTTKQYANVIKNGHKGAVYYGGEDIIALFVQRYGIMVARFSVDTTTHTPELFCPEHLHENRRGALLHHMFLRSPGQDHYSVIDFNVDVTTQSMCALTNETVILADESPQYRSPILVRDAVMPSLRCILIGLDGIEVEGVVTERVRNGDNCVTSYQVMVQDVVIGRFGPGRVKRHPEDHYSEEEVNEEDATEECANVDAKAEAEEINHEHNRNESDVGSSSCSASHIDDALEQSEESDNVLQPLAPGVEEPGSRRKRSGPKADNQRWSHVTLMTFLETVVAYNPFVKESGTNIDEKWQRISEEMSKSTCDLGEDHVTCNAKTLRAKFTRLKAELKRFTSSSKVAKVSGQAGFEKDKRLRELAEKMEECLVLIRDADLHRSQKKEAGDAMKKYRHEIVEPAMLEICASNQKYKRKVLLLLQRQDREMRKEMEWCREQKKEFVPSALQQKNMEMWQQCKDRFATDVAMLEDAPTKRSRLSEDITKVLQVSKDWLEQSQKVSPIEEAVMQFLHSHMVPAPMSATHRAIDHVREESETMESKIQRLNRMFEQGLLSASLHEKLVTKALGLSAL